MKYQQKQHFYSSFSQEIYLREGNCFNKEGSWEEHLSENAENVKCFEVTLGDLCILDILSRWETWMHDPRKVRCFEVIFSDFCDTRYIIQCTLKEALE